MSAPKLKDLFNESVVKELANEMNAAYPAFDSATFVKRCLEGLQELELSPRAWHIAEAMRECLPPDFPAAARVLTASMPRVSGVTALRFMPHAFFVQKYGLDHWDAAMQAQYEITKRFTAEFSIRAYLLKYPEQTYARLCEWAKDEDEHVRRLVSEGTRPRLPWAPRLRMYQEDPQPVLALLELLKDDPSRYVQRSVANNLNDIAKDHPDLAVEVCRRWLEGATENRKWIVKHALRLLVKQGHAGALAAMGAGGKPKVTIEAVHLRPRHVRLGGDLRFGFEVVSTAKRKQDLVVDYAVHYVKANGGSKPKVFKLRQIVLPPGAREKFGGKISFRDLTTRRHYAGLHQLEARINGVCYVLADFDVV